MWFAHKGVVMTITNETELILALRQRADKYGVVTGLSPTTTKDVFKFIEKKGYVSTIITKSGNYIKKIKLDEFNAYLEAFDLYYEAKGINTEKTMVWYLKSFGALDKEGKMLFRRVYSKNEAKRIKEGDLLAVDQKAMRKRLTRLATIAGKEVVDYIREDLGLEIDFEDRPFRKNMGPEGAKQDVRKVIEDMVTTGKKISKSTKSNSTAKLVSHGVERVDETISPFNDFTINVAGETPKGNIRVKVDYFEELVNDILTTWPEGIITGVQDSAKNSLVYGRMRHYYYGTPHDKEVTFSDFWNGVFATTPALRNYSFARNNNDPNKLAKREALVQRALTSPSIYIDDNGVKHMKGIFNDRKNYNILRSEAKMLGLTLEEYMYLYHGIIVDVVKKGKYETMTSRMIKASEYVKPDKSTDNPSNDGNEGM